MTSKLQANLSDNRKIPQHSETALNNCGITFNLTTVNVWPQSAGLVFRSSVAYTGYRHAYDPEWDRIA